MHIPVGAGYKQYPTYNISQNNRQNVSIKKGCPGKDWIRDA
jgi:hypothetical protein